MFMPPFQQIRCQFLCRPDIIGVDRTSGNTFQVAIHENEGKFIKDQPKKISIVILAMKDPLPGARVMTLSCTSVSSAFLEVIRLTPNCAANSFSDGTRSPLLRCPILISSRINVYSCLYRATDIDMLFFGILLVYEP